MKHRKQPHNKQLRTHEQQQHTANNNTNKLDAAVRTQRVRESFTYSIIAEKYVEHLGVRC